MVSSEHDDKSRVFLLHQKESQALSWIGAFKDSAHAALFSFPQIKRASKVLQHCASSDHVLLRSNNG